MSYSGTVRCGYCYNQGHNRLGCPERRKKALANPEGYEGRRWHREQEQRKMQIKNRTCSYCKMPEHNRRGCSLLKEDRLLVKERQNEYIKHFATTVEKAGIAPGALVRVPQGRSSDPDGPWQKGYVGLVTNICWENANFSLQDPASSSGWRYKGQNLIGCRVVSVFGYTDEENYWNAPPQFNEKKYLNVGNLHQILPNVIAINEDHAESLASESIMLLGPKHLAPKYDDKIPILSASLNSLFHFDPGTRADDYDKARVNLTSTHWKTVRKEEHSKAIADKKDSPRW